MWEAATICPRPCTLTFDLSTLKVVSRVTCDVGYLCANFSLSVLELGQMFVTDRETSDKATLRACALWRRRRNNSQSATNNIINLYVKSHDDCHIITAATRPILPPFPATLQSNLPSSFRDERNATCEEPK